VASPYADNFKILKVYSGVFRGGRAGSAAFGLQTEAVTHVHAS